MAMRGMNSMAELADMFDVHPDYMPRKVREGRWTLDDLDVISTIFDVSISALVSGKGLSRRAAPFEEVPGKKRLFEITFTLEGGQEMTCLEEAATSGEAITSITGVWGPPEQITGINAREKHYFQVHIPSLGGL
jgi:hypothetical protein